MNDSTITTQPADAEPDRVDRFVEIANKATKAGFAAAFGMATGGNRVRVREHTRRRPKRRRK